MSLWQRQVAWLEEKSDWLSPLVVKEVRQVVRGREFMLSFGAALTIALAIAFYGAAEAMTGSTTSGRATFYYLIGCLGLLGLGVVPLGAFNALRSERMEQTLDLIMLTSLSARRIVIGKLLAQSVKLATLFAGMAPFIAMSFLLGGIDLTSILVSLAALFMVSVWAGAVCLFLSTAFASRAMSGVVFGVVGLLVIFLLVAGRSLLMATSLGVGPFASAPATGSSAIWFYAIATTFWGATLANFVLLAENRLSLPSEDTVTSVRLGFFVQFLLLLAWTLVFVDDTPLAANRARSALEAVGATHLAIVAAFAVTDDFTVPRRWTLRMASPSRWRWVFELLGPGAGRGARYLLLQMLILLGAVALFRPDASELRWTLAACGYICFFTAVPALAFWRVAPSRVSPLRLRVAALLTLAAAMVLPDIVYYVIMRPEMFDVTFSARHLLNPIRTISNWTSVELDGWYAIPYAIGFVGLIAQLGLIKMGTLQAPEIETPDAPAPEVVKGTSGGDVAY